MVTARDRWNELTRTAEAVCLATWDFPGQRGVRDTDRQFEVLWTLNPRGRWETRPSPARAWLNRSAPASAY